MNKYFFLLLNMCFINSYSQELIKTRLSSKEKAEKIIEKYVFSGSEETMALFLYKNGTYTYKSMASIFGSEFSKGSWVKTGNKLELNSEFGANKLPLSISYFKKMDTPPKIAISNILNLKGQVIENAIVAVNNDSTKCSTLLDTCIGSFNKIEKIRVYIGDECYSKWVTINCFDYKAIKITIQSAINFNQYKAFNHRKYLISKRGIMQID
jgi:hypothetical protein